MAVVNSDETLSGEAVGGGGPAGARPVVLDPVSAEVAEFAAVELRRLEEAAGEPAAVRRDLLDDLDNRIAALLQDLAPRNEGQWALATLSTLNSVLHDDKNSLAQRWTRALEELEELASLATTAAPAAAAAAKAKPATERKAFWKR
jgi:Ca-activated chloride channel family protein